jgi:hypothetical protein
VLRHYGALALPCRVGAPDRKGKVESAIGHTQRTPLKGLRFDALAESQAYLDRWDTRWGDTRIHGTTKRQVAAMFAEERPALRPLPLEPFRYYQYGTRTVHLDGCVEVASAYYAPPPGWLGREIAVQWDEHHVRLLDPTTGLLLREHRRQHRGRHAVHPDDRPRRTPPTTLTLFARAARAETPSDEIRCRSGRRITHGRPELPAAAHAMQAGASHQSSHAFAADTNFLRGPLGVIAQAVPTPRVGGNALASNTTGSDNTGIGGAALVSNTIGGDNTAVGGSALGSNTTGGGNTASGV